MLVLTRRIGETITIGDDIRITVLEIRSGQVKVGLEAPRDRRIVREELLSSEEAAAPRAAAKRGHARSEFTP